MFCQNCSLSSSSGAVCKMVKTLLKIKRIFKTTLFDKEISLLEASRKQCLFRAFDPDCNYISPEDEEEYQDWLFYEHYIMHEDDNEDYANDNRLNYVRWHRRHHFSNKWVKFVKIIETKLTTRQYTIIWWYFDGMKMSEIGRRLGISGQAVNYAIFGHPVQGGGIVKKIKKKLALQ